MLLKYSFVLKTLTVIFALVLQNSLMCLLQIFNVICVYKIHQKATNKRNLVGIRKNIFWKGFTPKPLLVFQFASLQFTSVLLCLFQFCQLTVLQTLLDNTQMRPMSSYRLSPVRLCLHNHCQVEVDSSFHTHSKQRKIVI